jgi:glucose/arabinose dehydrogenase
VDHGTAGCNGAVKHVRDEEDAEGSSVVGGHVPRTVDVVAADRLHEPAVAVQHVKCSGRRRLGRAVGSRQAPDDHIAVAEDRESGREAKAILRLPGKVCEDH